MIILINSLTCRSPGLSWEIRPFFLVTRRVSPATRRTWKRTWSPAVISSVVKTGIICGVVMGQGSEGRRCSSSPYIFSSWQEGIVSGVRRRRSRMRRSRMWWMKWRISGRVNLLGVKKWLKHFQQRTIICHPSLTLASQVWVLLHLLQPNPVTGGTAVVKFGSCLKRYNVKTYSRI